MTANAGFVCAKSRAARVSVFGPQGVALAGATSSNRALKRHECPPVLAMCDAGAVFDAWMRTPSLALMPAPRPPTELVHAFVERFELLAEQPTMSRLRPEFSEDVRSFTVENYVIYYRYEGDV